jgi:hypothetical protein
MKTIIAGGRSYIFTPADIAFLDTMRGEITEVFSGKAPGADTCGEAWAKSHGIPVKPFPAKWNDLDAPGAVVRTGRDGRRYNVKAGFDRNREMAQGAEMLIAFPGGTGTEDMYVVAKKHGLRIIDRRKPCTPS